MNKFKILLLILSFAVNPASAKSALYKDISKQVNKHYRDYLEQKFKYFHKNPELSFLETNTARVMAEELKAMGYQVTTGIGKTGVVAILKNKKGPLVMMRADMDGLPVQEKTTLEYKSVARQFDPSVNKKVAVMHACGHDVHITSLLGTAEYMKNNLDKWSGTLMLIVQPAEERGAGAKAMRKDKLWQRFGTPDFALAFHVSGGLPSGNIHIVDGSPYAGVDSVDITVHGVGGHGASPQSTIDPIVLASQIVVSLQTLVSRTLAPREPGVVTVGSFHSGSKHNIISDKAMLQLTVRNTNKVTRQKLLSGIARISTNLGRAAGLPEHKLPDVKVLDETVPPTVNDSDLVARLKSVWSGNIGSNKIITEEPVSMGGEDFPYFTQDPYIKSVYFGIGGGDPKLINSGASVPSHHSSYFEIQPKPAVTLGVEATILALLDLMKAE